MSIATAMSPFDVLQQSERMKTQWPQGGGKNAANQFYQTVHVANSGNPWVDKKIVEETSLDANQLAAGVEPSMMFDKLNQTKNSFPTVKAAKNAAKMQQLANLTPREHAHGFNAADHLSDQKVRTRGPSEHSHPEDVLYLGD